MDKKDVHTSSDDDISFCAVIKAVDTLSNTDLSDRAEKQKQTHDLFKLPSIFMHQSKATKTCEQVIQPVIQHSFNAPQDKRTSAAW